MQGRQYTPAEIENTLIKGTDLLAAGRTVKEVCQRVHVSEKTFRRWQQRFSGMAQQRIAQLLELERQAKAMQRKVSRQECDIRILKAVSTSLPFAQCRTALIQVQRDLGLSEHRVRRAIGHRWTTPSRTRPSRSYHERLLARLDELSRRHPSYGYRRLAALLRAEGWRISPSQVRNHLQGEFLPSGDTPRKRRRLRIGPHGSERRAASQPGEIWAWDTVADHTVHGSPLHWLAIVDEYTRECLALQVHRAVSPAVLIAALRATVDRWGTPQFIRSDSSPDLATKAVSDWLAKTGITTVFLDPSAPWQNSYVESFNGRLRDELINREAFATLAEARRLTRLWLVNYNEHRPHSALGYRAPSRFARTCRSTPQQTGSN